MAQTLTSPFQEYDEQVRQLVEEHRQLKDEPLLLALRYQPQRDAEHIFLFEVIENFGAGHIDPDRELFEVTFASASGFPMTANQRLHLVMTNPREFEVALREHWSLIEELKDAIRSGRSEILYCAEGIGEEMLGAIA